MRWTNLKRFAAVMVASIPLTSLGLADAKADLITEWTFQVDSTFTAFSPAGVTGSNPNALLGGSTVLQWGSGGSGPSSLVVDDTIASPPNVTTNGDAVAGASIIHNNNPVSGQFLTSATLASQLVLTDASNPANNITLMTAFDIAFRETPNNGNCAAASVSDCDDIFVLLNPDVLVESFVIDDFIYTVTLGATGLGPLDAETCALAGEEPGCVGFTTLENASNSLQTTFAVTAQPISIAEPMSLALFGLGLIGMGAALGRRRAPVRI